MNELKQEQSQREMNQRIKVEAVNQHRGGVGEQ
jgi:hypothetical protein